MKVAILPNAVSKVDKSLLAMDKDLATCRFLFGASEAVLCSRQRAELHGAEIGGRIVAVDIDEAHCVSKW